MNLILFDVADRLDERRICLTDHRLTHVREVLASKSGEQLRIGEVGGLMGRGEIESIDDSAAVLSISLTDRPPPKLRLSLVLALPRPKMLRRILRTAAELGVAELRLINSYRVEKSYWQTPVLEAETVRRYFLQGLSQSRDTILPKLHIHQRFKPFVEDELPTLAADKECLLAHPGDYAPPPQPSDQPILLVVGPEGGFIPYEVEKLQQAGCSTVSLGPRILRVENAVSVLVSQLGHTPG